MAYVALDAGWTRRIGRAEARCMEARAKLEAAQASLDVSDEDCDELDIAVQQAQNQLFRLFLPTLPDGLLDEQEPLTFGKPFDTFNAAISKASSVGPKGEAVAQAES